MSEHPIQVPSRMAEPLFSRPLWRIFTISTTPRRLVAGGLFTLLMVLMVALCTGAYLDAGLKQGVLMYVLSYLACGILGALTCLKWKIHRPRIALGVNIAAIVLLPIVAMTMVECLNGVFTWDWSPRTLLLNTIIYWVFYGVVYVCSGSLRLPMLIVNPLFFLLAMTNYYVMQFRGTPFLPMDLLAFSTAMQVAPGYDFSLSHQQVIAILLLAFILIAGWKIRTPRMGWEWKAATRVFFGTLSVCVVGIYLFTNLYADAGLKPDYWNQARGYRRTGVVLNFCLNTKYLFVSTPKDYNPDEVTAIVTDTVGGADTDELGVIPAVETPTKTPNIICIMNESLADLSVLGDVQTNIPYLPYLNSLTENTVKGNLAVSVIGGGTSNSEFEFLTGTPMAFFPTGSNAYSLYIKSPKQTLVSALEELGYSSTAYHPYYSGGWNRVAVYDYFGFDRTRFLEDIIPNHILYQYQAGGGSTELLNQLVEEIYPGENVLMRQYVSDSYNYRDLINQYENRDRSKPFFLFNVTMQNHGGYTSRDNNFDPQVYLTGLPEGAAPVEDITTAYPKTNQYLSLIKYSDEAIEELISYFQQQDEPTVICIFGDHQPGTEGDYVRTLLGVKDLYSTTLEQTQRRYTTPFIIWANYDIPEQEIPLLSANYLSSYVMKVAGVDMPLYNQYLLKLSETIPVVNGLGIMDADGVHYELGKSPYESLLDAYEKVVYNHLFDEDNRQTALFSNN